MSVLRYSYYGLKFSLFVDINKLKTVEVDWFVMKNYRKIIEKLKVSSFRRRKIGEGKSRQFVLIFQMEFVGQILKNTHGDESLKSIT